jgi:hypothetical protein
VRAKKKRQERNSAEDQKEGSENDGDNGENAAKISVRWYYFVVIEIHVYAVPTISNVPILKTETSVWGLVDNKSIQSGRKAAGTAGRRHFGRFAKSADSRKVSSKSENASNRGAK